VRVPWCAWMFVAGLALGCAVAEQPGEGDAPGRDDGGDRADPEGAGDVDGDADADTSGDPGDARDDADPGDADAAEDAPPGTCTGAVVGGACWYLGVEERSCDDACAGHGAYSDATRTFAGSSGSDANCDAVLDALGVGGRPTTTLSASGAGAGCLYQAIGGFRYRVADIPTVSNATFLVSRRACACTP